MENGSTLLNSTVDAHWQGPPGPWLLMELEPAHRVFFGNLVDTLLRREVSQLYVGTKPAPFWSDVFVPVGIPWWSFLESALWHVTAVLALLLVSQAWWPRNLIETLRIQRSRVVYYMPNPAFPARESSPPAPIARREQELESQPVIRVAREVEPRRTPLVAPPDIAALTKPRGLPNTVNSTLVAPAMPMAATLGFQRKAPQMSASVIAPPPDIKQAGGSRSNGLRPVVVAPAPVVGNKLKQAGSLANGGLQAAVIAPAPEVGAVSPRRGLVGPKISAVAPPPAVRGGSLRGRSTGGISKAGDGDLLHVVVVAPAPELPRGSQGATAGTARAGIGPAGAGVVPPPPSVQGAVARQGRGEGSLGSGLAAVPPSPSVDGTGRLTGRGSNGLTGGSGTAVVPPPPSLGAVGRQSGLGGGSGARGSDRGGSGPGDSGSGVVPPPPSVDGEGGLTGSGFGGLSGGSAVPPAPAMEGAGGLGGRGDGISLGGSGLAVGAPPSVDGMGGSNGDQSLGVVVEDLPMRIVGLAFALPSTSFSSSYEVFIAEKNVGGDKVQLIKLVYWFLPYQRRLSDYHPDASKMYKLRVTRDHACDESLLHMAVSPTGQFYSGSHLPADSLPLSPESRNIVLPCYRTTADDYRKAVGKH